MKKFYVYLFLLLFFCLQASAQFNSVVVNRHDGSVLKIGVETGLSAKIADGDLVFTSSEGQLSIPAADVYHWSFSSQPGDAGLWSGISDAEVSDVCLSLEPGRVVLYGLKTGSRASLFALDGTMAASAVAGDDCVCVVPVDALAKGVYVLSYDNHSIKIILSR